MLELIKNFFSSRQFIPHGHCYLWKPGLVWLHGLSDFLIALAYYSIPIMLIYFAYQRRDVPFRGIFLLFGAFIISCGTTHLEVIALEAQKYAAKLILALDIAKMGSWDWDMKASRTEVTDRCRQILDYSDTEAVTYENWRSRVHPDDRVSTEASVEKALSDREEFEAQYRIIGSDGWMR